MKKYLLVLLLAVMIIPSVASASWWNPFSWNIFHKKEVPQTIQTINTETIKTPNEKIEELQKQLDELKNTQAVPDISPAKEKEPITPVVKKTEIKAEVRKVNPVIDVCLNIEGIQTIVPQGYASVSSICTIINLIDICPNIDGAQPKVPSGYLLYKNINKCITQDELDAMDAAQARLDSQESAKRNLEEKQNKLDSINLKIANLNAKYAKDKEQMKLDNIGGVKSTVEIGYNQLYSNYIDAYNTLMAEYQQAKYSN